MIEIDKLPEILASQLDNLVINYVIFMPQFYNDFKKISIIDLRDIIDEDYRANR